MKGSPRFMGGIAAAALLAATPLVAFSQSQDSAFESPARQKADVESILSALANGDAAKVSSLFVSAKDPMVHVVSAMALERIRYNLDASTADARICESGMQKRRPDIAVLCGQVELGNLTLQGRVSDALARAAELQATYADAHVPGSLKSLGQQVAYIKARGTATPVFPSHDFTLPTNADYIQPQLDATINGHWTKMVFDTGASGVLMSEADATRLGVKLTGTSETVGGWLAQGVEVQAGRLDTLTIGDVAWRDVPVTVVPKSQPLLIGGDMLAPLGTLLVTRRAIRVFGKDSAPPACQMAMATRSDVFGQGMKLVPSLMVAGTVQPVLVDTGSDSYLLGSNKTLQQARGLRQDTAAFGDIGGGHDHARTQDAKTTLVIGNQPIELRFSILPDSNAPWAFTLGAGALKDMDYLIDFRHQKMCMLLHEHLK